MRLSVKGKNSDVPDALRHYAEKKIQKLDKYFRNIETAELEHRTERGQHIIELNVKGDGTVLRSQERCNDMNAAVDNVIEKMESQVKRFKTRVRRGHQRPGPVKEAVAEQVLAISPEDMVEDGEEYMPRIGRRKRFPMKPMSAEEAARQMELLDHTFFLFLNEDTGTVNVLYQRRTGDYGLIEPEV